MNGKVFKLLSAICFAVVGTIEFIYGLVLAVRSVTWYLGGISAGILVYFIIGGLFWIGSAVLIFLNKNKLFTVIAFGIMLFWSFIGMFLSRSYLRGVFLFLGIAALCFYVLIYFQPNLIKLPATLAGMIKKVFWFIPAAVFFFFAFIAWFVYRAGFFMIVRDMFIAGGLLLAGLWLASLIPDHSASDNKATAGDAGIGIPASERTHTVQTPVAANVAAQPATSPAQQPSETWNCPTCGNTANPGNFCMKCGTARPAEEPEKVSLFNEDGTWNCPTCGRDHNPGNFCMKCGTARP